MQWTRIVRSELIWKHAENAKLLLSDSAHKIYGADEVTKRILNFSHAATLQTAASTASGECEEPQIDNIILW